MDCTNWNPFYCEYISIYFYSGLRTHKYLSRKVKDDI